jgi:hypothetical protein
MTGERESHSSTWLRVSGGTVACCHTYPDEAPILSLTTGRMSLDITLPDRQAVTRAEAGFARDLADCAARFAADCERLAAQHENTAAPDAGGSAAA